MAYTIVRVRLGLDGANAGITHAQLHTGAPGAAGTANVLAESSRQAISLPAASGDPATSQDEVVFPISGATAPITNVSLWDAAAAGNFYGEGALTPVEQFAGPGDHTVTVVTTADST